WLRNRHQLFNARRGQQRFEFGAAAAASDGSDHRTLGAANRVRLKAALLDAIDHVLNLLFRSVAAHIHDHFSMPPGLMCPGVWFGSLPKVLTKKASLEPRWGRSRLAVAESFLRLCSAKSVSHPQLRLYLTAPPPGEAARKGEAWIKFANHNNPRRILRSSEPCQALPETQIARSRHSERARS